MAENIISKGFYAHSKIPNFVCVKEYLVAKKGKNNQLFLRFENPKNETLTAISFSVDCYDTNGNVVATKKIEKRSLKVKGNSCFVVNRPVTLPNGHADFQVTIHSVSYGNYRYLTHGNEVEIVYNKCDESQEIDRVPFLHKMGGHTHKSIFKTLHAPHFFLTLFSLIIATLFLVLGIKLYTFTSTEELFTLDKVEYTFATENREDGPIIIVGIKSNAENIIIPDQIEGHDIIAIESNTFAGSNVRTIKCKGNIDVRGSAFADAKNLESIHIESTRNLGERAFDHCRNLTEVIIEKDLEIIEPLAFESCFSLTSVSLPEGLQTINDYAFSNCSDLESLIIPNSTSYIGSDILFNCDSLQSLQVPFIGESMDELTTLKEFLSSSGSSYIRNLLVTKQSKIIPDMFRDETCLESVCFLGPLTEIGSSAFSGCSGLSDFEIPVSVSTIENNAFANCVSLSSVVIPDNVTVINEEVFCGCSNLETITLPNGLTTVGDSAFKDCSSLVSLDIPTSVTYIGDQALYGCTKLTALTLPFLGNTISASPNPLSSIIANGSDCSLREFTLLSGDTLPEYAFADFATLSKIVLPSQISNISAYCFNNCTALSDVIIPHPVTSIGEFAFANCTSLKEIDIPERVTITQSHAFSGCSSLSSAVFRNNATEIGESAFESCSSLTYINLPSAITSLANNICKGCSALETIILPAGVSTISAYAFSDCTSLKSVVWPLQLTSIDDYAFFNCQSLPSVEFKSSVETIGAFAFAECMAFTSITIPETISYVGNSAFDNCNNIESMTAPFPTDYAAGVPFSYYFSNSSIPSSLKHITISSINEQYLPDYAFLDCEHIEEIILPNGLLTIGAYTFKNCASLISLVIPDTVTSMGYGVLIGTNALENLTLPYAGRSPYRYTEGFNYLYYDSVYGGFYYPENLNTVTITKATAIPTDAFSNMSSIRYINLPDTLNYIDTRAFSNCLSLRDIVLPASITHIGSAAFSDCRRLYTITNLSDLNARDYCPNALRIFTSEDQKDNYTIQTNNFNLLQGEDDAWYLIDYDNTNVHQELPRNVFYNSEVVKYVVPSYLFYKANIQTVNISPDVTKIHAYAFDGCDNLTSITSDDTTSFEEICEYAFYNLSIDSIEIPSSTKKIGAYAFAYTDIDNILIPASTTTIDSYAFQGCSSLTSVMFEGDSQLSTIGEYAFANTSITGISIPSSLSNLGMSAFYYCTELKEISFPSDSQLSTICDYVFYGTAISDLSLPASIEHIGYCAFSSCNNLESVTIRSDFDCSESFVDSNKILEVYNLAGLSLEIGSYEYGGVARNAMIIHTDANAERLHDVQAEGFNFKKSDNIWFLMGLSESNNATEIELTSFTYNGALVDAYVVYKSAFYDNQNIKSVRIGSAVTEIMNQSFYNCYELETLTFEEDCVLTKISGQAFARCSNLSNVRLPDSLLELGEYAFYDCERLESIVLPENLNNIHDNAFENCIHLYDVMNLSALNITSENSDYGYVGYYALSVRANDIPLESTTVTANRASAKFVTYNDVWYLVRLDVLSASSFVEIPKLTIDQQDCNYKIFRHALYSLDHYACSVFVYNDVISIDDDALRCLSNHRIYFYGNEQEFDNLATGYDFNRYTYLDCFHEDGLYAWRYDVDNNITTDPKEMEITIITQPSCKETGSQKLSCSICGKEEMQTLPITNEHTIENDQCIVCNKVVRIITVNVDSENFSSCEFLSNDLENPFAIDSSGVITSQNHSPRSSSSLMITATDMMTITFDYKVSSEKKYDKFEIYLNNSVDVSISGPSVEYQSYSITLNAGEALTFTYSKDYSNDTGDDCAFIKNLTITTSIMEEASS